VTRSPSFRKTIVRSFLLAAGVVGCNTILDNNPGKLDPSAGSDLTPTDPSDGGLLPDVPRRGDEPPPPSPDGGAQDPPDSGQDPLCAPGQRMCHGFCVGTTDPNYGCGHPTCEPCKIAHGTSACQANACAVQTCDKGYADCNQDPADGCEVDLSKATSCGACNAVCPAATPVCAPAGAGFQCTTGCTPDAPTLCGNECVATQTSVNHCSACNARCPDVDHAEAACVDGTCTFTCKTGYHACGGRCVVSTDPTACGPTCIACPVPANAGATCQADACAFQCLPGFGNCNQDPVDGCEANLASDAANCGGCGLVCNGTCTGGICTPTPKPDAGP